MSSSGKVMVIDDEEIVLRLTKARLEGAGYEVVTRNESMGTSEAVILDRPDIVIVDLKMPALDGRKLVDVLRRNDRTKDVPIIFQSGEPLHVMQTHAKETGIVGAIAKTGDDRLFIAQFERLFERGKRRREEALMKEEGNE